MSDTNLILQEIGKLRDDLTSEIRSLSEKHNRSENEIDLISLTIYGDSSKKIIGIKEKIDWFWNKKYWFGGAITTISVAITIFTYLNMNNFLK